MRDKFYLILIHIVLCIVVCFTVFFVNFKSIFGSEVALSNALRSALIIGSEYLVARNGQIINNAASENISDGSLGSVSVKPDYLSTMADAFSSAVPNVNQLISTARDFDVSNLSQADLAKFNQLVLGDDNLSGSNVVFKQATINGITAYWAVNQAGEWVGNSIRNIAVKFTPQTETLSDNINSSLSSTYDYKNLVFSDSLSLILRDTSVDINAPYFQTFSFDYKIYTYTDNHYLVAVIPANNSTLLGTASKVNTNNGYVLYNGNVYITYDSTAVFTINNVQYRYGAVKTDGNMYFASDSNFSSLDAIKAQIAVNGYLGDVVYSDLKDLTTDQGYVVPDVEDNVVGISDIYYAIQNLEDAINGLNYGLDGTIDGLTSGLTDAQIQSITQAITQAITKGFEDSREEDEEKPIELPVGLFPEFITDLLPEDMFSMFRPVLDIVGSEYSMYSLWILVPSILIFILILYLIVSVF